MASLSNATARMDIDEAAIDEGLYSRQLYASFHRYAIVDYPADARNPATFLGMKVLWSSSILDDSLTTSTAMKRMATSNVLIVGLQGLGVEIGTVACLSLHPLR